jgi:hypothetical protein
MVARRFEGQQGTTILAVLSVVLVVVARGVLLLLTLLCHGVGVDVVAVAVVVAVVAAVVHLHSQGTRWDHPNYDPTTLCLPPFETIRHKFKYGKKVTPAMEQWWEIKKNHFDCILFFKVGKFYELFHMDADVGVKILQTQGQWLVVRGGWFGRWFAAAFAAFVAFVAFAVVTDVVVLSLIVVFVLLLYCCIVVWSMVYMVGQAPPSFTCGTKKHTRVFPKFRTGNFPAFWSTPGTKWPAWNK